MPVTTKTSAAAVGISAGISVLVLLFYAIALATFSDLRSSDAAGNAYAQAFGAIEIIVLWLLLAVLAIIAWAKGDMPAWTVIAAAILVPVSGFVTMTAMELLSRPHIPPFLWPIVIPVLVPPLVVAFCFWALLPSTHVRVPVVYAGGVIWGAILLLCVSILPMLQTRNAENEKFVVGREKYAADFAKLPLDSPLWDWVPFLATPDQTRVSNALERIRHLERRQGDAEAMLDRGDFPLGDLGRLDLTPTPALCDKARALLRRNATSLVLKEPNSKPYSDIAMQVSDAIAAMSWLVDYDCSCDAESLSWETMAKAYRGTNYDIYRLPELRDPKRLGRALYENPERFSMLTPRAHLKAWLKFTEDKTLREQALAGARKLDHRTTDAIEILNKDEFTTRMLLEYLPVLDLEPTPPLCQAALASLHGQFVKIYQPKADDPRSYDELLGRLGRGQHFSALKWLVLHGCEADAELSEAERLIGAYKASPDSGLMLGTLERLHRKP